MSTRANIKIIKGDKVVWLYHHCDGYPEYLGHKLTDVLNSFVVKEYTRVEDIANRLFKDQEDNGFEMSANPVDGVEFMYGINLDEKMLYIWRVGKENDLLHVGSWVTNEDADKLMKWCEKYRG